MEVGFADLCMSYAWKCYENDHITMLQPKGRWTGGLRADIVEFAKEIIEQEVSVKNAQKYSRKNIKIVIVL